MTTIKQGSVYYFNNEEAFTTDKPHYFIVINYNPQTDANLFLCVATSKIEDRIKRVEKNGWDKDTLVFIENKDYKHFSQKTLIDCNSLYDRSNTNLLIKHLKNKTLKVCDDFPNEILDKIIQGILKSKMIPQYIKDYFIENNKI